MKVYCYLSLLVVMGLHCPKPIHGQMTFGTGSSRLEDAAQELNHLVEDREHIKEEFNDVFTQEAINQMSQHELAFSWYTTHDDGEDGLDGLELYKAILHGRNEDRHQEEASEKDDPIPGSQEDIKTISLVDSLLDQFDGNDDGILDFNEFMKALEDQQQLGLNL